MIYKAGENYKVRLSTYFDDEVDVKCTKVEDVPQGWVVTFENFDVYPYPMEYFVSRGRDETWQEGARSASGMPEAYADKDMGWFNWDIYKADTSNIRAAVDLYRSNPGEFMKTGTGLYIFSKTKGCGKTFLACCMANSMIRAGYTVRFLSSSDFAGALSDKTEDGRHSFHKLMTYDFLIFDDLGAGGEDKDWIAQGLFRLIEARIRENKPTFWTSNTPADAVKTDSRVTDRIFATSIPVKLPDEPIRRKLAADRLQNLVAKIQMTGA